MNQYLLVLVVLTTADVTAALAEGSSHAQSSVGVYADTDPDADLKRNVETLMGIYLVHAPRRHRWEKVDKSRNRITLSVWHPVGDTSNTELITRAVKWIFFGRTQYAKGARGVFSELPDVDSITLTFNDIVRKNTRRRLNHRSKDRIKAYLSITLSRALFESLDVHPIKECVERMDCRQVLKRYFKNHRINQRYIERTRRARQ